MRFVQNFHSTQGALPIDETQLSHTGIDSIRPSFLVNQDKSNVIL